MTRFNEGTRVKVVSGTVYDQGRDGSPEHPLFAGLTGTVRRLDGKYVEVTIDFPVEQTGAWEFYHPDGWYFYPDELQVIPAEED